MSEDKFCTVCINSMSNKFNSTRLQKQVYCKMKPLRGGKFQLVNKKGCCGMFESNKIIKDKKDIAKKDIAKKDKESKS